MKSNLIAVSANLGRYLLPLIVCLVSYINQTPIDVSIGIVFPLVVAVITTFILIMTKNDTQGGGKLKSIVFYLYYIAVVIMYVLLVGTTTNVNKGLLSIGVMFVILGTIMPISSPNKFLGIRVSWTMKSDAIWKRCHDWGGIESVIAGLVMIFATLLPHSSKSAVITCISIVCVWLIIVLRHSYIISQKMQNIEMVSSNYS